MTHEAHELPDARHRFLGMDDRPLSDLFGRERRWRYGGLVAPEESEDGDEPRPRVMDAQGRAHHDEAGDMRRQVRVEAEVEREQSSHGEAQHEQAFVAGAMGSPSHSRRAYHRAHRLLGTVEPLVGGASLHVVQARAVPRQQGRVTPNPRRRRAAGRTVSSQPAIR